MSWTHSSTQFRSLRRGQPRTLHSCRRKSTQGTRTASGQLSSEGRVQGQEPSANSDDDDEAYHRTDHRRHTRKHSPRWDRPVPFKDWHSENSRQCSQHSHRRETRSREDHSSVPRTDATAFKVDQPSRSGTDLNCVNKTDRDTAYNKQEHFDEIFNKMTNRKRAPTNLRKCVANPGWCEWHRWYEWNERDD